MRAGAAGGSAAFARALERVLPDGEVVRWDGSPLYLPCGDPVAAVGTRILLLERGARPDLPWELEVDVAAGTPLVVGTFTPPGPATSISVPVRAAFVAEAPDLAAAVVVRQP